MANLSTNRTILKEGSSCRPSRLVIYPKDVQMLTGKSFRSSQILLQNIRISLQKAKGQFITFAEFCQFTGMKEGYVYEFLFPKSR